jgi:MFS family permease
MISEMKLPKFSDIPKNVKILGLVSFFTDMSSDMIFPVLPLYLRNVLGINEATIGLMDGIANSLAEILKVFSGRVSDYLKNRKGVLFAGYFLSTIAKPFFALGATWQFAMIARVADRVGKGIRGAPKNALVAESTDKKHLGVSFGFDSMLDTLGAVAGTLILFVLLNLFKFEFRTIFLLSFIPATVALICILFGVQESKKIRPDSENLEPLFSLAVLKKMPKKYFIFLLISSIFSLGNISYSFLILKANDLGLNQNIVPIFYFMYSAVYAAFALPLGKMADTVGKSKIVLLGYTCFILVNALALYGKTVLVLIPMFIFYGVFLAANDGAGRALVAALVPDDFKATSIGLYQTIGGIMTLLANVVFGYIWTARGSFTAFTYSLTCAIIATSLLGLYKMRKAF